jgi:hypothetical protein
MRGGVGGAAAWLAATALVAGLAAVTTAPVSGASTAAPARPGGCADVRVVWAGGQARDAAVRELRRVPGQRVSVTAVAPPSRELTADDLGDIRSQGLRHRHFADWRARARRAVRAVVRSARACPDALVVLGGHSEGAVAARAAARQLARKGPRSARRHVGGLWLLGDPLQQADDDGARGVLAGHGPAVPRWVSRSGMLVQRCQWGDPVCGGTPGSADTDDDVSQHYAYGKYSLFGVAGRLPLAETLRWPAIRGARVRVPIFPRDLRGARSRLTRTLPKGLRISGAHLVGKAPAGRTVIRLEVRSRVVAPAVRRVVRVVLDAGKQAAAPGTVLVSRGVEGRPANGASWAGDVSGDGSVVAYTSTATNLVRGDRASGARERGRAYVWDAGTGRTELVSIDADGRAISGYGVQLSDSGRYVLFRDPWGDRWLRDRVTGTSTRVPPGAGDRSTLSSDGRSVTFADGGTAQRWNADTGVILDLGVTGLQAASPNGRYLALVENGFLRIWDTIAATVVAGGELPAAPSFCYRAVSSLSDDGRYVVHDRYCDRDGASRPLEVAGMRPLGDWGHDASLATASASFVVAGIDTVTLGQAGGEPRRILAGPRRQPDYYGHDLDGTYDDVDAASVAVSPEGRAVAFTDVGYDIAPGAYTDVEQVYLWTAG